MDAQLTPPHLEGPELRAALMAKLKAKDIATVRIAFDGCGDEGQIEDITAQRTDGSPDPLTWPCEIAGKILPGGRVWDPQHRTNVSIDQPREMSMRDVLDEWAYDLLDETGIDWVNNDGGFGEIVITPSDDSIHCEMNTRFVDHDTSELEL